MSNPVTNAEVEDVLSSIRRLVSEDKRPLQAKSKSAQSDRLVLTAALRVAEDEDVHSAVASDLDAQDWSEEDSAFEALHGADDLDVTMDDDAFGDVAPEHVVDDAADVEVADTDDAPDLDPEDRSRSDKMRRVQVQHKDTLDDPAQDGASDPYNFSDDAAVDGFAEDRHMATAPDPSGVELDSAFNDPAGDDLSETTDNAPTPQDAKAATLNDKIEALEKAIGKIADTWEPDSPGMDAYSGTEPPAAMAWEDDPERNEPKPRLHNLKPVAADQPQAEAIIEPKQAPAPAVEEPTENVGADDSIAFTGDDQLLDEEALRDLVSEIVRAELQGALGERITRNVRKLVRREIHRALTAQELE
tara:strand:+ start:777 stop:1853 length:1077 start_codon:yes stop_codon:yes gene_type:complete